MPTTKRRRVAPCDQCQLASINGLVCHETGCPNEWKVGTVECRNCGRDFHPKEKGQDCCSKSCHRMFWGY
jgi:hypothetical protein